MGLKTEHLEQLQEIFGDRAITAAPELLLQGFDVGSLPKQVGWLMNIKADAVVQPASPEEIQALYKFANETKTPLIPRGAGTSGYGGAIPRKGGIIVDIRWMDKILEIDKDNMTVTVEPGMTWANLQFELQREGLDVPCYPSSGLSISKSSLSCPPQLQSMTIDFFSSPI